MPPPKQCRPGTILLATSSTGIALARLDSPDDAMRYVLIDKNTKGVAKLRREHEMIALEQRVVIWGVEYRGPDPFALEVRFEGEGRPTPKVVSKRPRSR